MVLCKIQKVLHVGTMLESERELVSLLLSMFQNIEKRKKYGTYVMYI